MYLLFSAAFPVLPVHCLRCCRRDFLITFHPAYHFAIRVMQSKYGQLTLSELKSELRKRRAKTTGRKAELAER